MAHYQGLAFATRAYEGGGYGYATRDGIEIHLGAATVPDGPTSSAYLWIEEADQLAAAWRSQVWQSIRPKTPNGASTREP